MQVNQQKEKKHTGFYTGVLFFTTIFVIGFLLLMGTLPTLEEFLIIYMIFLAPVVFIIKTFIYKGNPRGRKYYEQKYITGEHQPNFNQALVEKEKILIRQQNQ